MIINKLPKDTGPAGWNAILPKQAQPRVLEEKLTADIAIIGGGFTGLNAARRLIQLDPTLKIILLEASRIGEGPAGRNSGFMIDLPHDLSSENYGGQREADLQQIEMNRVAQDYALSLKEELGLDDGIICQSGKINAAISDKGLNHNLEFQKHLETLGETSELLDAQQMHSVTGSRFYTSGLFTPGTVMMQPAAFIRALAENLSTKINLFETSPVIETEQQNSGWLLKTPSGSIAAGKVILATNGHAQSFGFFKRRFVHLILYASLTRAMSDPELKLMGGGDRWAATPSDPMGSSVRRISDASGKRILMRNMATYAPSMAVGERAVLRAKKEHALSISKRWPELTGLDIEHAWAGRLCLSQNSVPAFGEVETDMIAACCQNGLGTAKGTFAGMMAAEMSLGAPGNDNSRLLKAMLSFDPPVKLPPEPFATLGAQTILKWKQWQARAEL